MLFINTSKTPRSGCHFVTEQGHTAIRYPLSITISVNLSAFYLECRSLNGYVTHYLLYYEWRSQSENGISDGTLVDLYHDLVEFERII